MSSLLAVTLSGCAGGPTPSQSATPPIAVSAALSEGCARVGGEVALAHQLDGSVRVQCQLPNGKRCSVHGVLSGNCAN